MELLSDVKINHAGLKNEIMKISAFNFNGSNNQNHSNIQKSFEILFFKCYLVHDFIEKLLKIEKKYQII
jgi:hypothetical protein